MWDFVDRFGKTWSAPNGQDAKMYIISLLIGVITKKR
jgi:hypothetical protein